MLFTNSGSIRWEIESNIASTWAGARLPPKPVIDAPIHSEDPLPHGADVWLAVYSEPAQFHIDQIREVPSGRFAVTGSPIGLDPFKIPCAGLHAYLRAYARIRSSLAPFYKIITAFDSAIFSNRFEYFLREFPSFATEELAQELGPPQMPEFDEVRARLAQVQLLPPETASKCRDAWGKALRLTYVSTYAPKG